ncbi:MAG: hypothetical protein R3A44_39895 [Caldilineaceae bacterium]
MPDKLATDGQIASALIMPADEMNTGARRRRAEEDADSTAQNGGAEWQTRDLPIPQPHNITLRHQAGQLTVDWETAPNGYEVALVRGRHEILNQHHINPPATLLTDAVPAGEYCITVKARTEGWGDMADMDGDPCIVKLATPTQIVLSYNDVLQRLEVQWQPAPGAQGYRVQVVQMVADALVQASASHWHWGGASAGQASKRVLQAWVQAQGDERYYVDSNLGKSALVEFAVAGPDWGLFDESDFDRADFFPDEDEMLTVSGGDMLDSADEGADESWSLALLIEAKVGLGYTLDDNVSPPTRGRVAEDGLLVHEISALAEGCVITFDDGSEAVELIFEPANEEAEIVPELFLEELNLPLFDDDEEAPADLDLDFDEPEADEEENVISLVIAGKENSRYTLDDRINPPSAGQVSADGVLIHAVAPAAVGCTIAFQDGSGDVVEFIFSPF